MDGFWEFELWQLVSFEQINQGKSYIPQKKALKQENWLSIWKWQQLCFNSHHTSFSGKGPNFFSRTWQLFMRSKLPALLAQSSQILGLSNKLKHISELLVSFEKTAKNLTKCASKNLGVRKLNFPSVIHSNWRLS